MASNLRGGELSVGKSVNREMRDRFIMVNILHAGREIKLRDEPQALTSTRRMKAVRTPRVALTSERGPSAPKAPEEPNEGAGQTSGKGILPGTS